MYEKKVYVVKYSIPYDKSFSKEIIRLFVETYCYR